MSTTDLAALVGSRVDADADLPDDAKLLVLAALEGDEALADMAGFSRPEPPTDRQDEPEPVGAYLSRIAVAAFRGIGPEASLDLSPKPGLTIVAGRNGSGKSSFAEALEIALTGTTYRWKSKRSKQWQEAWRNLHVSAPPRIRVTLAEEDVGQTDVTVRWESGGGLDGGVTTLQRRGRRREDGLEGLGWAAALETYRPMLTYDELGDLLSAEPSRLYDALSTVLGLEQIAGAIKRLDQRHKELAEPGKRLAEVRRSLIAELTGLDDDRAARATKLVRATNPDVEAIRALATGTDPDTSRLGASLRDVLGLTLPDGATVDAVAGRLQDAVAQLAAAGGAAVESLDRRAALLGAAIALHEHAGDVDCPICGTGRLDASRARLLRTELDQTRTDLSELRAARDRLADRAREARELVGGVPAPLRSPLADPVDGDRVAALEAWTAWAELPPDPLDLVEHLRTRLGATADRLERLRSAAAAELSALDHAWAPIATRLAGYAEHADAVQSSKLETASARAALGWLKDHDQELKNERLRPIARQAIAIWEGLRQESNVEIADLTLEGANTRRHVEISSSVDGQHADGISVLSQGELHALALALFLPRATVDESPFRFVVLDDPVQAMDPSKVDGLLAVLSSIAESRQVVVFSHDDRLAAAARRGLGEATILEVSRDEGSIVTVRPAHDPAGRYLSDAFAMAHDDDLPGATKRRLLPGMLRMAVESAARDRHFTESLGRGDRPADVEASWESAQRTRSRVALAVFGDSSRNLTDWASREPHRRSALRVCTTAFHEGMSDEAVSACRNVERLVTEIRSGRR